MATLPIAEGLTPLEEYLSRCHEPDCEYEDGFLVERNVGEFEHSFLQAILATLFTNHMESWGVYALTEQRIRLTPQHYSIPDVCVLRRDALRESILTHPPLIVIEILSPEDAMSGVLKKCAEYRKFGVEHVWIIDPVEREAYRVTAFGLEKMLDVVLNIPDSLIRIVTPEIFQRLDQL